MEVRDPVHGSIHINPSVIPVIEHFFFKRLRRIKQLGLADMIFPGATHTRFLHSLGVMATAKMAFNRLFSQLPQNAEVKRLEETFKLGCLLHDLGHAPLSHSTEFAMPAVQKLQLAPGYGDQTERKATHEDYTIKSLIDSSFTESFKKVKKTFGVDYHAIAQLIMGKCLDEAYFETQGINFFPILHQLVSSEVDCDRMDYLLRDSYFCGVSYGNFDLDWLVDNLIPVEIDKKYYLGIRERAVSTFDDFLLSRYHMFIMVYFHYKSVCYEQLLARFFATSNEYQIPANIEEYQQHDDHYLMEVLRASSNRYAQDIVQNRLPQKVFESFNIDQYTILEEIKAYLDSENIEYIHSSSRGRLSKYYDEEQNNPAHGIKVLRSFPRRGSSRTINIQDATNLFDKYSEIHAINRLHIWPEKMSSKQQQRMQQIIQG